MENGRNVIAKKCLLNASPNSVLYSYYCIWDYGELQAEQVVYY